MSRAPVHARLDQQSGRAVHVDLPEGARAGRNRHDERAPPVDGLRERVRVWGVEPRDPQGDLTEPRQIETGRRRDRRTAGLEASAAVSRVMSRAVA
jgi:hypothetical protein